MEITETIIIFALGLVFGFFASLNLVKWAINEVVNKVVSKLKDLKDETNNLT